ncbi:hypothetical protein [Salipaludibacillus aurantiacus]|uniref:hypothetical protein n=1 Tax=Salipaludibacillus aurantiacus TaxID=1601833 RepID=UPI000B82ADC8|nr:hypothetical protein [Salipaludibacillus aurantiacus]
MIQKEIEKQGIASISLTHFPELSEKVNIPRALHIRFPLGRTFGEAGRHDLHKKVVKEMIIELENPGEERIKKLPFRWKRD